MPCQPLPHQGCVRKDTRSGHASSYGLFPFLPPTVSRAAEHRAGVNVREGEAGSSPDLKCVSQALPCPSLLQLAACPLAPDGLTLHVAWARRCVSLTTGGSEDHVLAAQAEGDLLGDALCSSWLDAGLCLDLG